MRKIIIIGGGISGLAAGCYARMNGYDTHIFEMHTHPGGLCTSWTRKGYTFDGSIHWLEGTSPAHPFHQIWRELGALKDKKIFYKDMSYKIFLNDRTIDLFNDPDRLKEYLYGIAPEDRDMIDELADAVGVFYPFQNLPLSKPRELFTVVDKIKDFVNFLPAIRLFQKYGKLTVEEFSGRFKSPVLQEAIRTTIETTSTESDSINGFVGVLFVLATKGSGFPEGGSLNLARSIEQRYTDLGGKIRYGAKVKKILVENDSAVGVQLEDGSEETADIVISASDGYTTLYQMLGGRYINKKIKHCYEKEAITPSTVQVSIGVNMDVSSIADPHAIFNMYPLQQPIMVAGKANNIIRIKNYSFDPSFAPKGKSTLVVIFASESAYWEEIYKDKEKYVEEKGKIEQAVISFLERIMPGIKEKIEVVDVATPMTYIRYTNSWKGAPMGFTKSIFLNLPRRLPGLKNLYMVGQWVGDMGVSGAAKSGRDIVQLICKQDRKRFIAVNQ
jgi:phytoene dehydrogenase-like protein